MLHMLAIALGGASGALLRYWVSLSLNSGDARLPWGTLACNLGGSFLMGVFFVLVLEKARLSPELRPLIMVGFLGAFTTFSTFSLEIVSMLEKGHVLSALIYISLSVVLSVAALYSGLWFTRLF